MLVADIGKAALLATIPVATAPSILRVEHLLPIACTVGVLDVFSGLAYASFLPPVAHREELAEGNAKLAVIGQHFRRASPGDELSKPGRHARRYAPPTRFQSAPSGCRDAARVRASRPRLRWLFPSHS